MDFIPHIEQSISKKVVWTVKVPVGRPKRRVTDVIKSFIQVQYYDGGR